MKVLYYQFSNNSSHFILIIKSPSLLLIHCSSFFVLVNRKTCGSKPFLPCFREGISQKGLFLMLLLQLIRSDLFNHSPHLKYTYVCFKYNAFIETTDIISFLKLLNQKQPKDTLMNMDFYMQIAKNVGLKESQNGFQFLVLSCVNPRRLEHGRCRFKWSNLQTDPFFLKIRKYPCSQVGRLPAHSCNICG